MDVDETDQAEYSSVAGFVIQGIVENENQNNDRHGQNASKLGFGYASFTTLTGCNGACR